MKQTKFLILTCVLFGQLLASVIAGLAFIEPWAGTWDDPQGKTLMMIREQDGFLDISGHNAGSVFRATCLIGETNRASCQGAGMNHQEGFRFLYQGRLQLDVGRLEEQW